MGNVVNINQMKADIRRLRRHGDIKNACVDVGCAVQIFWNAMNRKDDMYSDLEILVIKSLYGKIAERIKLRKSVGLESC